MKKKHTPLPWKVYEENEFSFRAGDISTKEGKLLFENILSGKDNKTKMANAEFITRACNSHYELLEALERLTKALNRGEIIESEIEDAEGNALKIIAKVRGE